MSEEREGAVRLPKVHEPGLYRIRISGRVDPSLAERIGGMVIVLVTFSGTCTWKRFARVLSTAAKFCLTI